MNVRFDLRSDTVTMPDEGMRDAMARARVGDDVYGEDPTVNALQEEVAALFGKEAGLFVPSGTMSNQIAVKLHTDPGDEVICEEGSHVFQFETAAPAIISGVQMHPVRGEGGVPRVEDVEAAIRPPEYYYPTTRLLCIENTHNRAGGRIVPLEVHRRLFSLARAHGIAVHLDGARIWHAHVETAIPLAAYGGYADTVSVCFSKGLGAPVGSMLLGTRAHILRARKIRKTLGGAMRQAGVLAAAAEYALRVHLPRLAEDHAKARRFAEALAGRRSFSLDISQVETNMVLLQFPAKEEARAAVSLLADRGIGTGLIAPSILRVVFHRDIPADALDEIIGVFSELFD